MQSVGSRISPQTNDMQSVGVGLVLVFLTRQTICGQLELGLVFLSRQSICSRLGLRLPFLSRLMVCSRLGLGLGFLPRHAVGGD